MDGSQQVVETPPGSDEQLQALSHVARRRLLVELMEQSSRATVPVDSFADGTVASVDRVDLRHRHLPKLQDMGVVRWDREAGVVARGPAFRDIEPLLTLLDDHADRLPGDWS